ncbi:MAG TPA: hypothetical protein VFE55_01570 [Acidimicrobiia bacterium]|nr:hypothetical protein [Acidimicrobiia bacterium]
MGVGSQRPAPMALRILYVAVVAGVAVVGLLAMVDWGRRGNQLPGGGVPVTGRVIEERPGFSGAPALVEVAYPAGGRERRARLPVAGSADSPQVMTYEPGDAIALLVSRTNPDRVQQVGWDPGPSGSSTRGWLFLLAAAGLLTPLLLPGPRRRLQAALPRTLKSGGGRGI